MNLGPRWYVVHTYSGYENKVKLSIEKIVENRGLGHLIYDVQIPIEKSLVSNEKGQVKEVETKIFPTYVLVKMTMTDESWHVVRNITGVTGFVGPGSKPVPLTEEEVEFFRVESKREEEFALKVGKKVKLVSGAFAGYEGVLQEISEDKKQVTVLVSTGRRDIPVIVDAKDVCANE
ncbi:MAG: transcription termination/antitermination factor NusG [Clostridia bacterium]|nr:transcription termination/antitermination factor NusG [Clostridia bacterium]MBQ8908659.1 transcription termination/antitermination factor NusG [Clostridia bacterium]